MSKSVVIVVGASSGLGEQFALQLDAALRKTDEIWLIARRKDKLVELSKKMRNNTRVLAMDITNPGQLERLCDSLSDNDCKIRMLVNCAGYGVIGDFAELGCEEQMGMIRLNCEALTHVTHVCVPFMAKNSRIIQIASCAAFIPQPGFAIYAATKAAAEQLAAVYDTAYDLPVICVRAFNHFGPGQREIFVVSDFCRQAAEIECGLREPVIRTGNLDAKRDFTDVRDIVRAYVLLLESGRAGEIYNVGSGKAVAISDILSQILSSCTVAVRHEIAPEKLRPAETSYLAADTGKLRCDTGWMPEIPTAQTISDTLAYWRQELKENSKV